MEIKADPKPDRGCFPIMNTDAITWSETWQTDSLTGDTFVKLTGAKGGRSLTLAYFKNTPDGVREHCVRYITAYLSVDEVETVNETESLNEPSREV